MEEIIYPFLNENLPYQYVSSDNEYMQLARIIALVESLDNTMPVGSVIVKNGRVIGMGANGSIHHIKYQCKRVKLHIPTGQGYDLCKGCHPKNHSEARAIREAKRSSEGVDGADIYTWGHWWCCKDCNDRMKEAGIANIYLMEGSEIIFNKEQEGHKVGQQFANLEVY